MRLNEVASLSLPLRRRKFCFGLRSFAPYELIKRLWVQGIQELVARDVCGHVGRISARITQRSKPAKMVAHVPKCRSRLHEPVVDS
eukprot:344807-Hanusia_phi.AAC.17